MAEYGHIGWIYRGNSIPWLFNAENRGIFVLGLKVLNKETAFWGANIVTSLLFVLSIFQDGILLNTKYRFNQWFRYLSWVSLLGIPLKKPVQYGLQ